MMSILSLALKTLFLLSFSFLVSCSHPLFRQPLSSYPEWEKRLQEKIPAQGEAEKRLVLSSVVIENQDFSGMSFQEVIFKNNTWTKVKMNHSHFKKLVIRNSKFSIVDIQQATIDHLVIENSNFDRVSFREGTIKKATIRNTKIRYGYFMGLKQSQFHFEDSNTYQLDFVDAEVDLSIVNTRVIKGSFLRIKSKSLFIQGNFVRGKFFGSQIDKVRIEDLIGGGVGLGDGQEVFAENNHFTTGLGLSGSKFKKVVAKNNFFEDYLGLSKAEIDEVLVDGCRKNSKISAMITHTINHLIIKNCHMSELLMAASTLPEVLIQNSSINGRGAFYKSKIKNFTLDQVYLNDFFDYKNFQVESFIKKGITKGPKFEVRNKGSNIEL